eukprot:CAMPEP_0183441172 /NCGR_PEP_ID=MMETSP0370-20130417/83934_1 /TAXON_ID=268820 /ORGANISM="Peridinium aciculiferum, Strain PAER-2" /LENGTH=47 /DNA_ID= /DNA_START= /DNA_END= /DNA_ORIENTATION=
MSPGLQRKAATCPVCGVCTSSTVEGPDSTSATTSPATTSAPSLRGKA